MSEKHIFVSVILPLRLKEFNFNPVQIPIQIQPSFLSSQKTQLEGGPGLS